MQHKGKLNPPIKTINCINPCPPYLIIPFGSRRSEEALSKQEGVIGQGVHEFLQLFLPAPVEISLDRIYVLLLDFYGVVLFYHFICYHL